MEIRTLKDKDGRFIVVMFVSVQMQTSRKGLGKEAKLEIGLRVEGL